MQEQKQETDPAFLRIQAELMRTYHEIDELEQELYGIQIDNVFSADKGLPREHYKKIQRMVMGKSSSVCSICLYGFDKGQLIKKLPCKHIYHKNCIKTWLEVSVKCPICRLDLQDYYEKK